MARGEGGAAVFEENKDRFDSSTRLGKVCVSHEKPEEVPAGIRCDPGYGTATHVIAVIGMIAAVRVPEKLAE